MKLFGTLRSSLLASLTLVLCALSLTSAQARDWYIEGRLGTALPSSIDLKATGFYLAPDDPREFETVYEPTSGFLASGTIGMYVRPDIRIEAAVSSLSVWDGEATQIKDVPGAHQNDGTSYKSPNTYGNIQRTRLMFNALYEFAAPNGSIVPYVGLGIGYTWYHLDDTGMERWGSYKHYLNGTDGHFTYAFHVGADIPLRENLFLTSRYTLSNREEMTFKGSEYNAAGELRRTYDAEIEDGLAQEVSFGLKYKFGRPAETYKN